ncbi:MAG: NAD-dependent epimerase/dehydratase family protein [Candidatus Methanofastidiosia archaeon]
MKNGLSLVTGANGHLGNNLVRILLKRGRNVRASVRNLDNKKPFEGTDCEIVYADLLDKDSLLKALEGVDTLFQVAAVFKHFAKDPGEEIIKPVVEGTKNILEAAKEQDVSKIVYVSSTVALGDSSTKENPFTEKNWNTNTTFPYFYAKTKSEKIALELARELNLWLVTVLPSGMVGPNNHDHLTPSMELLHRVLHNELFVDVGFNFTFVDVRDVAEGMLLAEERGRNGERYILAIEDVTSTSELVEIAQSLYPFVRKPLFKPSKSILNSIALLSEFASKITGKPPLLMRSQVELFHRKSTYLDISKAREELGYSPRPSRKAIKECFEYLRERG